MCSQKLLLQVILLLFKLVEFTRTVENDENFYFVNNNNKFFYNHLKNCKDKYYFDFNYFKCRLCDENFNLIVAENSK